MHHESTASRHSRREAFITICVWVATALYTVLYAAAFAYRAGPPQLILGVPSWVVWGVFAPWGAASLITMWFAMRVMRDEDLDAEPELTTNV